MTKKVGASIWPGGVPGSGEADGANLTSFLLAGLHYG